MTDCDCKCHRRPGQDEWSGWCFVCNAAHEADLVQVVRMELLNLWGDMSLAWQRRMVRTEDTWSMAMEDLCSRIRALSRIVGAVPWGHISVELLKGGVYEKVYEAMEYPPIDWREIARVEAYIQRSV